jgi:hypothetical protein
MTYSCKAEKFRDGKEEGEEEQFNCILNLNKILYDDTNTYSKTCR